MNVVLNNHVFQVMYLNCHNYWSETVLTFTDRRVMGPLGIAHAGERSSLRRFQPIVGVTAVLHHAAVSRGAVHQPVLSVVKRSWLSAVYILTAGSLPWPFTSRPTSHLLKQHLSFRILIQTIPFNNFDIAVSWIIDSLKYYWSIWGKYCNWIIHTSTERI